MNECGFRVLLILILVYAGQMNEKPGLQKCPGILSLYHEKYCPIIEGTINDS